MISLAQVVACLALSLAAASTFAQCPGPDCPPKPDKGEAALPIPASISVAPSAPCPGLGCPEMDKPAKSEPAKFDSKDCIGAQCKPQPSRSRECPGPGCPR